MKRRHFLRNSALAVSPILLPTSLLNLISGGEERGRHKVFIHLKGGNDWFNTVVPLNNDDYIDQRPSIALDKTRLIQLNEKFAFNDSLVSLSELYRNKELQFIDRVTTIQTDVSHFSSTESWKQSCGIPELLAGRDTAVDLSSQLDKIFREMGREGDFGTYAAELDGFDMHQFQLITHDLLLSELDHAIDQFTTQLKRSGLFRDTLIVIWSEFGRSMTENIRKGTDHGTENSILLVGGGLSNQLYSDLFSQSRNVIL